jgi:mitochondrial import inner membrane translocase subunit TIM10
MDRCVAKYLQLHDRLGKGLTEMSQQEDKTMQEHQQNMVAAAQKLHNK